MWKRGGRSSALDRAEELLSAKRSSRGGQSSTQEGPRTQGSVGGSVKPRSEPPNTNILFSALSDLSSGSSAADPGPEAARPNAEKSHGRELDSNKDVRPQSSLGGGSRFLKKVPAPTNSSQSPLSRNQIQELPEPRYVSSSQHGSQTAALSKLAEIESRIRSRKQARDQANQGMKPTLRLTSDIPPPAVTHSSEELVQFSTPSSGDQSLKGNRFLKSKAASAIKRNDAARAEAPKSAEVRVRSRAGDPAAPSGVLETKPGKVTSGVSLESDEEDMRRLLGDSVDSTDNSFLRPERPSSTKKPDKMSSKSSRRHHSTLPSPAASLHPSSPFSTAPPRFPASPPRRGSPFRFTGEPQAHFSPSVLSLSPSPPLERPGSSHCRVESPSQRSLSSVSGRGAVLSLEELFPVRPDSEEPQSERSSLFSGDFKINVMTLDDLAPATLRFTMETPRQRETEHNPPVSESLDRQQLKEDDQQQEEEDVLDYQSDFESGSRTESNQSASQVSEHLQGDGGEEEALTEIREEDTDVSRGRTEDDYSSHVSEVSHSCTSKASGRSQTANSFGRSRSRDSRSSTSQSRSSSQHSRRHISARKGLKDAAVQTQPDPLAYTWSTGVGALDPTAGATYVNPTPVLAHTVSAEMVEAMSTFNPAAFALNEILKQQLAMIKSFIETSHRLHTSLLQSLEPPNYRYATLKDIKELIHKQRPPKMTMEEVLEEVHQEIRDRHCTQQPVQRDY